MVPSLMISWNRTLDGWAVNLDGSNAAQQFTLPRIELHSGRGGWTCVCRLQDGTSRPVPVDAAIGAAEAKRAGVEDALLALGAPYESQLRALL
jgi:invasion protein IalB